MNQANAVIDWIGNLKIDQGDKAGEKFEVLPWQARFIRGTLNPDTRISALSIGRANGKTTLVAALATVFIRGPLAQENTEVVTLASVFNQATLCFEQICRFLGIRIGEKHPDYRVTHTKP